MSSEINSLIACPECDLLVRLPLLDVSRKLSCPRCHHTLSVSGERRLYRALPMGVTAALLLVLSLSFPFMSFERSGVSNEMTLLQTSMALFQDGSVVLSLLVFGFIIMAPMVMVGCILIVSMTLATHRWIPGVKVAARIIYTLTNWNMVEVFIIGVFVSLVKIAKMATVELGFSLWAYLALSLVLVGTLSCLDKVCVWRSLTQLEPHS
ncbi:MAG: paraquat-inducible protein A [Parahaliea sp.]